MCALCLAAGCDGSVAETGREVTGTPVTFATSVDAPTRAGDATTANLTSMGVYAYYTGQSNFNDSFSANFMNNQAIRRSGAAQPWTYSPVKYWPNAAGEKITFFAYSPHASLFTETDPSSDPNEIPGGTFNIKLSGNLPLLEYAPRLQAEKQTDVLVARLMNCTKTAGSLTFQFVHLLAKCVFKVKSTEQVHIDRINLRGATSSGYGYFLANGNYEWDERYLENKEFYSLPDKDVPANALTAVSTFFMVPYGYPQEARLDVFYTTAGGTAEEKKDIPFSYMATWSGHAVEYTIVMDKTKLSVKASTADSSGKWDSDEVVWGGESL